MLKDENDEGLISAGGNTVDFTVKYVPSLSWLYCICVNVANKNKHELCFMIVLVIVHAMS